MPTVRSNWLGCFCWNSFYRFYRYREMPTTLKITGEYSYVATNVLTNASWLANLCEWIALAATNVFEILTLLLMAVRTQFANPSWPRPQMFVSLWILCLEFSHQCMISTVLFPSSDPWTDPPPSLSLFLLLFSHTGCSKHRNQVIVGRIAGKCHPPCFQRRAQRGITPHEHSSVNCPCFLCCEQVAVQ